MQVSNIYEAGTQEFRSAVKRGQSSGIMRQPYKIRELTRAFEKCLPNEIHAKRVTSHMIPVNGVQSQEVKICVLRLDRDFDTL